MTGKSHIIHIRLIVLGLIDDNFGGGAHKDGCWHLPANLLANRHFLSIILIKIKRLFIVFSVVVRLA